MESTSHEISNLTKTISKITPFSWIRVDRSMKPAALPKFIPLRCSYSIYIMAKCDSGTISAHPVFFLRVEIALINFDFYLQRKTATYSTFENFTTIFIVDFGRLEPISLQCDSYGAYER